MSRNKPLTDRDRAAWLRALRRRALGFAFGPEEEEEKEDKGPPPSPPPPERQKTSEKGARGLVITCSALKRRYRDVLRRGDSTGNADSDSESESEREDDDARARVRFVFLDAPEEVLWRRARLREGHFAREGLVRSQMEALERPGRKGDEDEEGEGEGDVVVVRVGDGQGVDETVREVLARVRAVMVMEEGGERG